MNTRTKIVATLGPASWEEPMIAALLEAGVDVFRINCSHADHEAIRRQVARVRRVAAQHDEPAALLLDLQGPKIRTGAVKEPIALEDGDTLTIVMDPGFEAEGHRVGTTYPQMVEDVTPGVRVLFADGALEGVVSAVRPGTPGEVDVRIEHGGELGSHKGINLPDVAMSVPSLTEKDLADLAVGVDVGVDYVALSFVQTADDVRALKRELERLGKDVPVIAKIEKPRAVDNLDDILDVSEGIMVARGDLGVEVPIEAVPVFQKRILEAAFRKGRIAITATQMLDSMERNPRPTRAETTDVANAILDGTDAVMLSGETSIGRYPVEAVRTMDRIARLAESSRFFRPPGDDALPTVSSAHGAVIRAACVAARELDYPLVVYTWSGHAARLASKYRPPAGIYALSPDPQVVDRLSLVWGVTPVYVPPVRSTDDLIQTGEQVLLDKHLLSPGDGIVVVAGRTPMKGATHLLKVYQVGDT